MGKIASILGFLIILSGIYQLFFGVIELGILILICCALITVPGFFTSNRIEHFPIEVEILLFLMVLLQFILGEVRDFYTEIPYYDKIVHSMIPMFMGIIGFLIFHTIQTTGKLKASIGAMIFLIILMTLGIGAFWEILEYASDTMLYPRIPGWHHFQGNAQQDPLTDTMTDLVIDTLGAIFGSLIGLWYLRIERSKNPRRRKLVAEVGEILDGNARKTYVQSKNR